MPAPLIFLHASIAAAEDINIAWELKKFLDDCVFINAAQETEILNLLSKVDVAVMPKIVFEFEAF